MGTAALTAVTALHLLGQQLKRSLLETRADMERRRGLDHSPPTPESTEWLNALLAGVWPLIPSEMFTGLSDMVEDVMQASLPNLVTAVRIADMSQGRNPLRIIAMRGLPDLQGCRLAHGDDWIDQGKNVETGDAKEIKDDLKDQAGDYVNYEVSLAYVSRPKKDETKSVEPDNMHLMIEFYVGIAGWAHVPIRIWIEVRAFVCTARLRLQLVEQMPFIRNCTITLTGTPHVDVSAVPLSHTLPNVLDLPLISGFVQSSIAAACIPYTAPHSITLNLAQLLLGDGTKKDTIAIGVLMVTIHHAEGLKAADSGGIAGLIPGGKKESSDPYVVAAWSKFGKPIYSTRVMTEELNPVWEETCFLVVTPDEVTAEERVSIQLWDSDARNADDIIGRVEVDLLECMKKGDGQMIKRTDGLTGFVEGGEEPGQITWSYGFYRKVELTKKMKERADAKRAELSSNHGVAEKGEPDMQPTVADTPEESQTLDTPPDPKYPSGIFSIIIQNINNLENQDLTGQKGKSIQGKAGQPTAEDAEMETHDDLPSSYCEIMINDDLIYRTRTKAMTSAPYFAAGTERFLRDYTTTTVRVAVRDSRLREHDALLGVVTLPLGELFSTQSQVTRLFSLQDGVGFGRVNISLLFRGVSLQIPKPLRGWETGTVEIIGDIRVSGVDASLEFAGKKLTIKTADDDEKIKGKGIRDGASGDIVWKLRDENANDMEDEGERRIPVYHRYASAVVFDFGGEACAAVWLQDIPDGELVQIQADIMLGKKLRQISQSYPSDKAKTSHPYEVVGKAKFTVRFDRGLDEEHMKLISGDQRKEHTFDAYMAAEGAEAQLAEARKGRGDDGEPTKREKQIEQAELHRRGRGVMQVKPMRTLKWMGDGLKNKTSSLKDAVLPGKLTGKQPDVETEV